MGFFFFFLFSLQDGGCKIVIGMGAIYRIDLRREHNFFFGYPSEFKANAQIAGGVHFSNST